jgi:hypothetical protein
MQEAGCCCCCLLDLALLLAFAQHVPFLVFRTLFHGRPDRIDPDALLARNLVLQLLHFRLVRIGTDKVNAPRVVNVNVNGAKKVTKFFKKK